MLRAFDERLLSSHRELRRRIWVYDPKLDGIQSRGTIVRQYGSLACCLRHIRKWPRNWKQFSWLLRRYRFLIRCARRPELTARVCLNSHRWAGKQLTLQRNSSLDLSARPGVPLFTSEVLFQRSACTCCTPRYLPSSETIDRLERCPFVDKAPSSTAFYFRCRSPKRIAIRSPFPSARTSESSMKRRLRKAHILNRKRVVRL